MRDDESFERLRAAVDALAAGDAVALVADARAEARSHVRSILTDAMADSMLERVLQELERTGLTPPDEAPQPARPRRPPQQRREPAPEPEPEPQPQARAQPTDPTTMPPPTRATTDLGWYVYGVVAADQAVPEVRLPGVDPQHEVTTLREGGVAAVVSRVPLEDFDEDRLRERLADMEWLERTARAHEEVLDAVREQVTLIPMRLCSIYRTRDGVREMLQRDAKALEDALERLEGKTEWGVKVFADPEAIERVPSPELGGAPTPDTAPGPGAEYMERRRQDRLQRERNHRDLERASERIHERLCAVATEGLTSPLQRPEVTDHPGEMILNGVYLVPDVAQQIFSEELHDLQTEFAELGLELEPTGPWPAYNFVAGTIWLAW
jgi:hypothetical protein